MAQISLAVVLLSSALSMVRSASAVERIDPGFDPDNVLTLRLSLPPAKYASGSEVGAFFDLLTHRLEALPGVEAASAVLPLPQSFSTYGVELEIPGREPAFPAERLGAHRITITPRYFESLGIPLLSGRSFTDHDLASGDPVVIVNHDFVERYWPGQDPVGRTVGIKESANEVRRVTVVGVVGNVRDAPEWQGQASGPQVYLPWAQQPLRSGHLVLRGSGDPKALIAPVHAALRLADADLPVSEVWTMAEVLAYSVSPLRIAARLLGGFSLAAMLLAAVGIYSVVAFAVSRRRREFGVRLALGGDRGSIAHLVLRQGAVLTAIGVVLGLAMAIALGQLIASQMPSVGGFDGPALLAVAAVLGLTALAASFLPAWRASRMDPLRALRYE